MNRVSRHVLVLSVIGTIVAATVLAVAATSIRIDGSDTLVRLGMRVAHEYMKINPDVRIRVSGGGSGSGFLALIEGRTDICEASRDMGPSEYQRALENGVDPYRVPVARDGIVVYVNPDNPVQSLTLAQLRDIYTGRLRNWQEVGGPDLPVRLYGREPTSGTFFFFTQEVLDWKAYDDSIQVLPSTAAVVNAVSKDVSGIGYGGIAWTIGQVTELAVARDTGLTPVAPSNKTIADGSYPISRPLLWYFDGKPTGAAKGLLNWVLSEQGQALAKEAGYVPLLASEALAHMVP